MKFRFLYRRALRQSFVAGQLPQDKYEVLMDALRRPRRLMDEIEKYTMEKVPKSGNILQNIVEWLKDHWDEIIKLILAILPLFLKEPENKLDSGSKIS